MTRRALTPAQRLSDAEAWDARVAGALARAPERLQRMVAWLRHPPRRWIRVPAGVLFIVGGLLAILPVLGLWMLPLGLALLSEDIPALKGWLEHMARGVDWVWAKLRPSPRLRAEARPSPPAGEGARRADEGYDEGGRPLIRRSAPPSPAGGEGVGTGPGMD